MNEFTPVTGSLAKGETSDDNGVPLGMINYMILNRSIYAPVYKSRIGSEIGILWFVFWVRSTKRRWLVWNDKGMA